MNSFKHTLHLAHVHAVEAQTVERWENKCTTDIQHRSEIHEL